MKTVLAVLVAALSCFAQETTTTGAIVFGGATSGTSRLLLSDQPVSIYAPDGRLLATVDKDGNVKVIGTAEEIVRAITRHLGYSAESASRQYAEQRELQAKTDEYIQFMKDVVASQKRVIELQNKQIDVYRKALKDITDGTKKR